MTRLTANPTKPSARVSPQVAENLERLAWLMDRAIRIPGTRITLGLDALFGLLPGGGDLLTGIVQAGLVLVALHHYRVPRSVAFRMAGNVLLDMAVGAIPILGDLFDVAFKANTRNLKLLEPYRRPPGATVIDVDSGVARPRRAGTPLRYVVPIAILLMTALALVVIGLVTVVRWLIAA